MFRDNDAGFLECNLEKEVCSVDPGWLGSPGGVGWWVLVGWLSDQLKKILLSVKFFSMTVGVINCLIRSSFFQSILF